MAAIHGPTGQCVRLDRKFLRRPAPGRASILPNDRVDVNFFVRRREEPGSYQCKSDIVGSENSIPDQYFPGFCLASRSPRPPPREKEKEKKRTARGLGPWQAKTVTGLGN